MDMQKVMTKLYESEINCSISAFWDGGWTVKLGDEMNGFEAEANFDGTKLSDAADWLDQQARERYPTSLYATGKYPDGWRPDGEIGACG